MPTFNDGTAASNPGTQTRWLTIAELVESTDRRTLAQLGSDNGTALTFSSPAIDADDTSGIITNAIERACGEVAMFARRGGRYDADRLDALAAADDWGFKGIIASIAVRNLHKRRSGGDLPPAVAEGIRRAEELLTSLGEGAVIFNDEAVEQAGKADIALLSTGQRGRSGLVSDQPFFRARRTTEI